MSECKIAGSLETAKKDIVRITLSSFFPFPDSLGRMNGITLAVPLSGRRRIIMSFCDEENGFRITAQFEDETSNIGSLIGRVVGTYGKDNVPEGPIEECLN